LKTGARAPSATPRPSSAGTAPAARARSGNDGASHDCGNGNATAGAPDADTIEACMLRNLERYFSDLDGSRPHALHEMVMRAVERPLLRFALERCGGNQSAAAELLGINRNTLRKKLLDYRVG
jgi:Fis family transcriptional regulator